LAYLPGTRGTALGQMADEFTEGSVLRQVGQSVPLVGGVAGPVIGAQLLSDRSEQHKRKRELNRSAEGAPGEEAVPEQASQARQPGAAPPAAPVPPPAVTRPPAAASGEPGEEIEERIGAVGASIHAQAGRSQADADRSTSASDLHGEEVEERIAALGATLQTGQIQQAAGLLRIEGANDVARVLGDAIAQLRVQRSLEGQPLAGGADHITIAQGITRAMGVTPQAEDRAPIQGDVARLGLFGDLALRLGLTGQQAQTVISEVKQSSGGQLTPQTHSLLVEQARGTLNTGSEGAERAVSALQRAAVLLPDALTARGTLATPNVQVQVNAPAPSGGLDDEMKSQAGLAGSQKATTQRGDV